MLMGFGLAFSVIDTTVGLLQQEGKPLKLPKFTVWPASTVKIGSEAGLPFTTMFFTQVDELPEASVARQVRGVVPSGKEPGVGVNCVMVIAPEPVQLSVAVGAGMTTLELGTLSQELTVMVPGLQLIVGAVPSVMVMTQGTSVKLPAPSEARQVTVIV